MSYRIFMRFPEGKAKALTFSYDDGVKYDAKLVEILDRYGMKGTFNLNSGCFKPADSASEKDEHMTKEEAAALFQSSPHEVAVHAVNHPFLEELPPVLATEEVLNDRLNLEAQFGRIVRGMAYPQGTYSRELLDVLKSCGIAYARTIEATNKFDLPENWLLWCPTCHHNAGNLMDLAKYFAESKTINKVKVFYVWGHTFEFNRDRNWDVIENLCAFLSGYRENVWFATNSEIYEYTEDYRRLVWSADGKKVYNPTARTLWMKIADGVVVSVGSGKTCDLEMQKG